MKIRDVLISNILSFPEVGENRDEALIRLFDPCRERETLLSLLVGRNGTGKSNFMDALTVVFNATLNSTASIDNKRREEGKNGWFTPNRVNAKARLPRHRESDSAAQFIELTMQFDPDDLTNIRSVVSNADAIDRDLGKSGFPWKAPDSAITSTLAKPVEAKFRFDIAKDGFVVPSLLTAEATHKIVYNYFCHFGLIEQYFASRSYSVGRKLGDFRRTFALLSGARDQPQVGGHTSYDGTNEQNAWNRRGQRHSDGARMGYQGASIFEDFRASMTQRFGDWIRYDDLGAPSAVKKLEQLPATIEMNDLLSRHVGIRVKIALFPGEINRLNFLLADVADTREVRLEDLSSGQRSLVHLIASLYGADVRSGMVFVDEPELHLHPQFQRLYMTILLGAQQERDLQIVSATHSPLFVSAKTFPSVLRFSLNGRGTMVTPRQVTPTRAAMVRTLEYLGAARVLFADHVLLVEGETDEYFARRLIEELAEQAHASGDTALHDRLRTLEVLSIGGKGQLEWYTSFLGGLGIQCSYMGDLDNISQLASSKDVRRAASEKVDSAAARAVEGKGSRDGERLMQICLQLCASHDVEAAAEAQELIGRIRGRFVQASGLRERVEEAFPGVLDQEIDELAERRIYILRHGELEDYLGGIPKGLDSMIEFCDEKFATWFSDRDHPRRAELITIVLASVGDGEVGEAST